jgi:hypothetical protein
MPHGLCRLFFFSQQVLLLCKAFLAAGRERQCGKDVAAVHLNNCAECDRAAASIPRSLANCSYLARQNSRQ